MTTLGDTLKGAAAYATIGIGLCCMAGCPSFEAPPSSAPDSTNAAESIVDDGEAWREALPELLQKDVEVLAGQYAGRHCAQPEVLEDAGKWIAERLTAMGLTPVFEPFDTVWRGRTVPVRNVMAEIPGTQDPRKIIVIGAHYDSEPQTPGADDNASGVAGVLALAEYFSTRPQPVTLRFVLFTNEEMPFFHSSEMGSMVRAGNARAQGDKIVAMLCLEMIGYYTEQLYDPGSIGLVPSFGAAAPEREDFIAFVAWPIAAELVKRISDDWPADSGAVAGLPVVGSVANPAPGLSDNWAYWMFGYPAVMITDTAFVRNPNYHEPTDTADTLDYARMASVVDSLSRGVVSLANQPPTFTPKADDVEVMNKTNADLRVVNPRHDGPDDEHVLAPGETKRITGVLRFAPLQIGNSTIRIAGVNSFDGRRFVRFITDGAIGRADRGQLAASQLRWHEATLRVIDDGAPEAGVVIE